MNIKRNFNNKISVNDAILLFCLAVAISEIIPSFYAINYRIFIEENALTAEF